MNPSGGINGAFAPDRAAIAAEGPQPILPAGAGLAIRGGALRVTGYGAGVLVSLGAATILVRHLGLVNFGRYVTVTSLVALVGGVTEAGIVVYGIREFIGRDDAGRRHLLANLLALRLVLTSLGVICAICFAVASGYRSVLVVGTLVAGVGLLAQVAVDVLSVPLQSQLLLGRLTFVELTRRLLSLVLIAVLALIGAGLLPMLAAGTLAAAVALPTIAWIVRPYFTPRLTFHRRVWRALFAETLPYAIALSLAAVYLYVTVILMSLIATEAETGLFATSFRIVQAGLVIPSLLLTAVFPLLTRAGRGEDLGAAVGKILTVAVMGGAWMSLATALGAHFMIDVVAGNKGGGAVPVLRVQGLVFIVSFLSTSSALILLALRRYRALLVGSVSALLLDILLGLILIPALGAEGGAIADVATESVVAVGFTFAALRAVPEHRVRPSFLPPLVLACGLSALVLLLPIGSLAQATGASVIYFGTLALTRSIPREVIDAARRLRPG